MRAWWQARMQEVFERLPGFGGFLIKADSEGRAGPFTYGRSHADGANMLAKSLGHTAGSLFGAASSIIASRIGATGRRTGRGRDMIIFSRLMGSFWTT